VKIFSDEWWDILHTALKTATELNIQIGIFNSPGWSDKMKKTVVLLGGKISAGKNTAYDIINQIVTDKKVVRQYFAQGVKKMSESVFERYSIHLNKTVSEVLDILAESDDEVVYDEVAWRLESLLIKPENWYEDKTESTRILLQTLGADIIRNKVSENYWVDQVSKSIIQSDASVIVITDFRYENEFYSLRDALLSDWDNEYDIMPIHLIRTSVDRSNELIHSHESENSLDTFVGWKATIVNNGAPDDLRKDFEKLLIDV
jgi:hypothetical protein